MADWDDPSVPREPVPLWQELMLEAAGLLFLGSQILSDRPLGFVNRPMIDDVAPLPPKADRDRYASYIYARTYMIPKLRRPNTINFVRRWGRYAQAAAENPDVYQRPAVRVGYSVREIDAFGMPFFAYKEAGYVLYFDDWDSDNPFVSAGPIDEAGLDLLRKETGHVGLAKDWFFPFWAHMWGWVPLSLAGAWGWLLWRRRVRRREQLGII
jgi:hypothetical protein